MGHRGTDRAEAPLDRAPKSEFLGLDRETGGHWRKLRIGKSWWSPWIRDFKESNGEGKVGRKTAQMEMGANSLFYR